MFDNNTEGRGEIVGIDVGTSEDGAFWLAFLRSLSARGLSGVDLVVSDAHQGLSPNPPMDRDGRREGSGRG